MEILNPESLIQMGGLGLLLAIVFAETGLFFGFFLPGDSLLFVAGLLSDSNYLKVPIPVLIPLIIITAVAGTTTGYFTGRWARKYLEGRKENFFYRKEYIEITQRFYERYGMMAFIVGRFLPIVRTFVPILAGMARINFMGFLSVNILGAIVWITTMVLAGHWMGRIFPGLIDSVEWIVLGLVVVSAIPVYMAWQRHRVSSKTSLK